MLSGNIFRDDDEFFRVPCGFSVDYARTVLFD
jgi:hypothetical protein